MSQSQFSRDSVNQLRLHVLPTDRFKTYAISLNIGVKLSEEDVTATALIPHVLRRGTARYPETKAFREKLDDLFGAGFGFDIYKRGDYQVIQFRMDVINDDFVAGEHHLLEQALSFLGDTIARPALDGGLFRQRYVDSEKNTLRKRLESIVNDKIRYAAERCLEEMFAHDPYRLNPLGKIEALAEIDAASLHERYLRWLGEACIDLYVVGSASPEQVKRLAEQHFQIGRSASAAYEMRPAAAKADAVRTVVEKMDVTQGKLNMGLRTNMTYADPRYAAALMYNGVLGAYPHSKLFVNVREKASLAYYASSRLDAHKGLMTIQSGIEFDNMEKATDIMKQQLDSMRAGDISDTEMMQTRAMLCNALKETHDSAFELIAFDFNNRLAATERTVADLLDNIAAVTVEDIRKVAAAVQLDTIYFLRNP